jgi:hypothetical protein
MMTRARKPARESAATFQRQQSQFASRPFSRAEEHEAPVGESRVSFSLADIDIFPRETLQPKLKLGPVGDRYEREADRMARQVVQTISSTDQSAVQRQDLEDEDELDLEEGEELRRKVAGLAPAAWSAEIGQDLESAIQRARSGGKPLSDGVRQPMERAFGADFGGVRVHADGQADRLNRSIQARAFTTGRDIFLRQGEYRPGSFEGQRLLAHELTHVVQQGEGKNQAQSKFIDHRIIKHKKNDSVLKQPDNIIQMKRPSEGVWHPDTEKIYEARGGKNDIYNGGRPCHFSTTVKQKLLNYWSAPRFNWVKRINDRWIVETPRTHYFLPPEAIQIDHLTPWATYEKDLTKNVDTNRTDIPEDAKTKGKFSVWGARMYYHDAENLVPEVPSLNAGKGAQLTEGVTYSGAVSEKSNKLLGNISQVAFSLSEWQNIWARLDQEGKMDTTAIGEIDIKLQTIFDSIIDLKNFTEELNI